MSHLHEVPVIDESPFRESWRSSHPVKCSPRDHSSNPTWVTVAYAVDRLKGYYDDDPPGWMIQETILAGTPLHTIAFIYQYEEHK